MLYIPDPEGETKRLAALRALDVLDSRPEAEFDALVQVAARIFGVPIALISLVDAERQWFKASIGLPDVLATPRDISFCAYTIMTDELLEIPDARQDPRFCNNPLVIGQPGIRFYAGAPLRLQDGSRVGTLCVIDIEPREFNETQRENLRSLAAVAARALEGRQALRALVVSEGRFRALSENSPVGLYCTDAQGNCTYTNQRWQDIFGLSPAQSLGQGWVSTVHPQDRAKIIAEWQRAARGRVEFNIDFRILHTGTDIRYVHARARAVEDEDNEVIAYVGSVENVTERRDILQRLTSIIDGTHVGTWEWHVQTGAVKVNERLAETLGYTLAELGPVTFETWMDHLHPDDHARSAEHMEQHFAGRHDRYDCEVRMRHRDGHWVWVLGRGRVASWTAEGAPEWMFGTHQEVTQRVHDQLALQSAKERLTVATEGGGVGIWDLDLTIETLSCDPVMCRLYGVEMTRDTEHLEFWTQYLHPDDRAATLQTIEIALQGSASIDIEFRIRRADGVMRHVRASGRIFRDGNGRAVRILGVNLDVTEQRLQTAELAAQHELLQVTLNSIGDSVITTDAEGRVVWLNPVAERMTGWLKAEAQGRLLPQVFHIISETSRQIAPNPVAMCMAHGKVVDLANHTVLISRTGEEHSIEDSAAPILNDSGSVLGVVLVFHDVTEQRRLSSEMNYRAAHDVLTGLVNRSEFELRLRRVLTQSHEAHNSHALMYIDLDQFKLVNDACGHAVGDQLLQQVSTLLQDTVRDRDTLARLGGDEFGVILEHCAIAQAQRVAEKICQRMDDFRFNHEERRFRIGTSIGLVPIDDRWATPEAILQAADTSCYAAKEAGRNRVHVWFDTDTAMRARHGEMQWTTRIERALDENRFVLFAQRIVALDDEPHGVHAEVLLRMKDGGDVLVQPGAFLPAAERFHLASRIDRWVLKRAIAWITAAPSLDFLENLSVNLSGQSVGDRAFHRWAVEVLSAASEAICRKLCFEITETAAVTNLADAALFFEQIRALGVRVALDDFGAGASSFGYLKTMPVDFLKIDGQFIRGLVTDPLDEVTVRCFIDIAKVIGMKTVAEFVDQPEVLTKIRAMGIDFAQGFLLHKPEPIDGLLSAHVH